MSKVHPESVDFHAVGVSSDSELNPFRIVQRQVDEAAQHLKLDPGIHELLRWPLREIHVSLPVRMDDGSTRVCDKSREPLGRSEIFASNRIAPFSISPEQTPR